MERQRACFRHPLSRVTGIGAVIQQGQHCFVTAGIICRRALWETVKEVTEEEVSYMHDPKMNEEKQDYVSSNFIALAFKALKFGFWFDSCYCNVRARVYLLH